MNGHLLDLAHQRGFITRPEILAAGHDDRDIRAGMHGGLLTRVGAGLYTLTASFAPKHPEAQHAIRSRGVAHRFGDGVALTHQSAAAVHGLPLWGLPLDDVHVTRRDDGRGRHDAHVRHHVGRISDSDIVEVDGVLVSSPARCVWEIACTSSTESGVVTADAALHARLVTTESLLALQGAFAHWRGSRTARITMGLADGRSESPGESRSRHLFWRFGIPSPDLQFRVVDAAGYFIARVDFAWELYRHLAEFDGRVKYDGTFDTDGFESVFSEKRREDLVRAENWGLSRLIWSHLDARSAKATAQSLRTSLERSRQTYTRNRVVIL